MQIQVTTSPTNSKSNLIFNPDETGWEDIDDDGDQNLYNNYEYLIDEVPDKPIIDLAGNSEINEKSHIGTRISFDTNATNESSLSGYESNEKLENVLYEQISTQSLKLIQAALTHKEQQNHMSFKIQNTLCSLQVVDIKGDGNCLFRSLAHQLRFEKLGTRQQNKSTNALRKEVVEIIKKNFNMFQRELKGAVFDRDDKKGVHPKRSAEEMRKDCEDYLKDCLSKPTFWGGSETLKAVSMIYEVNIAIFTENGDCYLATEYDAEYEKMLLVAYKLATAVEMGETKLERNHYESVTSIDSPEILLVAKHLAKSIRMQNTFKTEYAVGK